MIFESIQNLIGYAIACGLITSDDELVVRNQLMQTLALTNWETPQKEHHEKKIDDILGEITDYACEKEIIKDTTASRDLFDTKLMGIFTPFPHEVIAVFRQKYSESPASATDWYYQFSQDLNYVRKGRIARNLAWKYQSSYGQIDITINRSKPEKDPRDIAAAKAITSASYPKCQLCPENAGFAGNFHHPARQNLRPIPLTVGGEKWQFQYSPYGYYNEHCIIFHEKHVPMKIDASVFEKLLDVLEYFPHYFIGSNADLPIVGGSILSHEHFQGGRYTFAMEKAAMESDFVMPQFPDVQAGIVKWPMSVMRLKSENRKNLSAACYKILQKWRSYSDESVQILAETNGVPHNTITPIVRMNGNNYECDLVLRNNRTTKERPLGLFHPNPTLHHIKKENIGLIEVMGLAVLPARLDEELNAVIDALLCGKDFKDHLLTASHADWAKEVAKRHPDLSKENALEVIHEEVGKVFEKVLLDAGVFRRDETGKCAFQRFIHVLTEEKE